MALAFVLFACKSAPVVPLTAPPRIGSTYPATLGVAEPGQRELVIVINDNLKMMHAGMFVGSDLFDPAGSYASTRRRKTHWPGTSLHDYLRFQLDDGPAVRLYRFSLPPDRLAQIQQRLDQAGHTLPLFCAAKVQNILSGITPFESVPDAWLVSPAMLAGYLDAVIGSTQNEGTCVWPDGTSCYPATPGEALETAKQ